MKTILIVLSSAAAMLLFLIVVALLRINSPHPATPPYQSSPAENTVTIRMHRQPDGHAVVSEEDLSDSATASTSSASVRPNYPAPANLAPTDEDDFWATIESKNIERQSQTVELAEGPTTKAPWVSELEQELEEGLRSASPAPSPRASRAERVEAQPPVPSKDPDLQLGLEQTSKSSTSLRNTDYPNTYISRIDVDLTSPNHWVRLTWSGPDAASQETGPFHSSPGRGLGNNNCDDVNESNRQNSNCTPKGTMHVQGFSEDMRTCRHCKFVTWFNIRREVAFHYYPDVPNYPASHGCVRLEDMHAAQLIHNNSKIGATEVKVAGKWTFGQ
jgi:hypothetical protein